MNHYIFCIKTCVLLFIIDLRKAEGVKLVYDEVLPPDGGNGALAPIILLHGLFSWRKDWMFIAPNLSKNTGRKVYALDAQNHGNSPWTDDFSFPAMIEDLDEFLVDHNISKAVLIGHSLGGRTAMIYALQKPEKVEKIVVEDVKPGNISSEIVDEVIRKFKSLEALFRAIHSTEAEEDDREYLYRLFRSLDKSNTSSKKMDLETFPIRREENGYALLANTKMLFEKFTTEKLNYGIAGVFKGNALFLYGTKSPLQVDKDETIPHYFPRAKLVGFDTEHLIHQTFPEQYTEKVSNFINENESN